MSVETDARIVIDRLLRESAWDIENPAVVSTEEAAADGRADYLLKDSLTRPLVVLEAKRFSVDPYGAKTQTRDYAAALHAPFILLSNGREHYLWEYDLGDARPILGFPTQADLERRANLRHHRRSDLTTTLAAIPLPDTTSRMPMNGWPSSKLSRMRSTVGSKRTPTSCAGRLLVPLDLLHTETANAWDIAKKSLAGHRLDNEHIAEYAKEPIAVEVARRFGVSADVIIRRLDREKLWPPTPTG